MTSCAIALTRLIALVAFAIALASCTPVLDTSSFDSDTRAAHPASCDGSALGAYMLPKKEISFVILKTGTVGDQTYLFDMKSDDGANAVDGPSFITVGDGKQRCLNYHTNAFYEDLIRVDKDSSGQLLENVYSGTVDRTPKIAEAVAQGIVAAAAGNRDFRGANNQIVYMTKQFDLFDQHRLTEENSSLRDVGYCIYIDPTDDPYVPLWMQDQCSGKKVSGTYVSRQRTEDYSRTGQYLAGEDRIGILYKPLLSHTLVILKKDDPTSAKPWRVWRRQVVEMPNRAPIFLLQVRRGMFTTRKTTISFDDGLLLAVKIDKQSELKGLTDALVNIVGIAVQLPAKALILRQSEVQNQAELIKVNQQLLASYALLEKERERNAQLTRADGTTGSRSGPSRSAMDNVALEACVQNAELNGIADPRDYCQTREAEQ